MDQDNSPKPKQNPNAYLKYTGMVGQLFALLLLAAYGGKWIDSQLGNEKPLVTALLLLVAVVAYLWKVYVDLSKPIE